MLMEADRSELREVREMETMMSAVNQSTDGRKLTQNSSLGQYQIELKEVQCATNALPPETSLRTTHLMSNSPRLTSLTQEQPWSSLTQSGNLSCQVSPSTVDDIQRNMTPKIGDFTISTREASTSKSVKTVGDWFIAWNQTAAMTVFAFLHQSKEC